MKDWYVIAFLIGLGIVVTVSSYAADMHVIEAAVQFPISQVIYLLWGGVLLYIALRFITKKARSH